MSFNIIKTKNKNLSDCWIELADSQGNKLTYPDVTKEQLEKYQADYELFEAGELKEEPTLKEFEKPVRIKFKSIHAEAFKKAQRMRKMKDQLVAQGIYKNIQKEATELKTNPSAEALEAMTDKLLSVSAEKMVEGVDDGAKMLCENAIDWEGFLDADMNPLEFDVETLFDLLVDPKNLGVYTSILKAVEEQEVFFTA